MLFKCLLCGFVWDSRIANPTRCADAHCGSYWVVPVSTYEEMIEAITPKISDDTPILDTLITLSEIFKKEGFTLQARRPLLMARRLIEDAESRIHQQPSKAHPGRRI